MDRLRTMEIFARVVEQGSFTRAASSLGLPRATVTAAVQDLEARLELRLLYRTTRRLSLSADGAVYYEEATRLLRELGELESGLRQARATPRGRVRVDVPASAGRHVLAPALPEFLARYPEIQVELGSTDRPVDLLGEGVDCALRGGEVHDDGLVARPLGALPVITCAAPAYLAVHGTPTDPGMLDGHLFVSFFSPRSGRHLEVDFSRGGLTHSFVPRHRAAANDADTWLALAAAGLGLVQLPYSRSVRALVATGALVRVLADWEAGALPLYAVSPQGRQPARVRVFLDWLAERYAVECREAADFLAACFIASEPGSGAV